MVGDGPCGRPSIIKIMKRKQNCQPAALAEPLQRELAGQGGMGRMGIMGRMAPQLFRGVWKLNAGKGDGTRKQKLYRFKKFWSGIFKRWLWPKAALKSPQSKRSAKAERSQWREASEMRRFADACTRSQRMVMAARWHRGDSLTGTGLAAGGLPRRRYEAGANITITKRTQIKLRYKRLIMRTLIRNLRFSKSRKRTQTNPNLTKPDAWPQTTRGSVQVWRNFWICHLHPIQR